MDKVLLHISDVSQAIVWLWIYFLTLRKNINCGCLKVKFSVRISMWTVIFILHPCLSCVIVVVFFVCAHNPFWSQRNVTVWTSFCTALCRCLFLLLYVCFIVSCDLSSSWLVFLYGTALIF
jgi:hypothetical protein